MKQAVVGDSLTLLWCSAGRPTRCGILPDQRTACVWYDNHHHTTHNTRCLYSNTSTPVVPWEDPIGASSPVQFFLTM
ncbi:hypothetical protein BDV28DRAFT_143624 [Aspergillus coremiiformis]|uniref:Uncharacterized protein n=1 Tax=Aspergillus coremiiformis TaxID=138285 RepID=A0A5N6YSI0_9EURO|nr:hypothetical protein BDV28DRAFT_143624 [Aspergillus coremiiformis]